MVSAAPWIDMLPAYLGALRFDEFHPPPPDTLPLQVIDESAAIQTTAQRVEIIARVVDTAAPAAVSVAVRNVGGGFGRWFTMRPTSGYEYRASISADSLPEGLYEYAIVVTRGDSVTTFPSGVAGRPNDWDFRGTHFWPLSVVRPTAAISLFQPLADAPRLSFTRIGDAGRRGIFRTLTSPAPGSGKKPIRVLTFSVRVSASRWRRAPMP